MSQLPEFTDVTDVENVGNPTTVWLGRKRHYIENGDELTFLGDTQRVEAGALEYGKKYRYVGPTSDEPHDAIALENVDTPDRVKLYREGFRFLLREGQFHIHDA